MGVLLPAVIGFWTLARALALNAVGLSPWWLLLAYPLVIGLAWFATHTNAGRPGPVGVLTGASCGVLVLAILALLIFWRGTLRRGAVAPPVSMLPAKARVAEPNTVLATQVGSQPDFVVVAHALTGSEGTMVRFSLLRRVVNPTLGPTPTPGRPSIVARDTSLITMQILEGSKVVCTFTFDTLLVSAGRGVRYRGQDYWLIGSSVVSPLGPPCRLPPGTYRLGAATSTERWLPSEPFTVRPGAKGRP